MKNFTCVNKALPASLFLSVKVCENFLTDKANKNTLVAKKSEKKDKFAKYRHKYLLVYVKMPPPTILWHDYKNIFLLMKALQCPALVC